MKRWGRLRLSPSSPWTCSAQCCRPFKMNEIKGKVPQFCYFNKRISPSTRSLIKFKISIWMIEMYKNPVHNCKKVPTYELNVKLEHLKLCKSEINTFYLTHLMCWANLPGVPTTMSGRSLSRGFIAATSFAPMSTTLNYNLNMYIQGTPSGDIIDHVRQLSTILAYINYNWINLIFWSNSDYWIKIFKQLTIVT